MQLDFTPEKKIYPLPDTIKLVQSHLEHQIYVISIFETEFHPKNFFKNPLPETIKLGQPQLKPLINGIAILAIEFHPRK